MDLYYGIDVASEKHNCCIMDKNEKVLLEFSFSNDINPTILSRIENLKQGIKMNILIRKQHQYELAEIQKKK